MDGHVMAHSRMVDMQEGVGIHSRMEEEAGRSQIVIAYELPSLGVAQHLQFSIHVVLISGWNEHLLPVYER